MRQSKDRVQMLDVELGPSRACLTVTVGVEHGNPASIGETNLRGNVLKGAQVCAPDLRSGLAFGPGGIGGQDQMGDSMLQVRPAGGEGADRNCRGFERFAPLLRALVPIIVGQLQSKPEGPDASQSLLVADTLELRLTLAEIGE